MMMKSRTTCRPKAEPVEEDGSYGRQVIDFGNFVQVEMTNLTWQV
jgi:hypothetical protein